MRRWAGAVAAVVVLAACSSEDDPGPRSESTTSSTEAPSFTGDASSPFCTTLAGLDVAGVLGDDAASPDAVAAGFTRLVEVLDGLADIAPEEVRADAELLAEGIIALDAALAEVRYDFDALAATPQADSVIAAVNDPAFTVAGDRLVTYRRQVCNL